jgi:uncharacterized protein (DUF1697 family)
MPRCVAFLRGMNVGGHRITNDELRAEVVALGFDDVATFRASGNVIFAAPDGEPLAEIAQRIEEGLADALGYAVPVFARTAKQLRAIAAFEPFAADLVAASKGKLQVTLLAAKPTAATRKQALALATDDDRLAIEQSELYWLPSGGVLESELDQQALTKLLGVATTRTKGTIDLIAAKLFAD